MCGFMTDGRELFAPIFAIVGDEVAIILDLYKEF